MAQSEPTTDTSKSHGSLKTRIYKRREIVGAWASVVFVFFVISICISPNLFHKITEHPVGQIWAGHPVVTPYDLTVADDFGIEMTERRLISKHPKVFIYQTRGEDQAKSLLANILSVANPVVSKETTSAIQGIRENLIKNYRVALENSTVDYLVGHESSDRIKTDLDIALHHLYGVRGVTTDKNLYESSLRSSRLLVLDAVNDVATTPSQQNLLNYPSDTFHYLETQYIPLFSVSEQGRNAYLDILKQIVRPNIVYDRKKTDERLARAIAAVPRTRLVPRDTVIASLGQTLTGFQVKAIFELEKKLQFYSIVRSIGGSLAVALAMFYTTVYLRRFKRDYAFTSRNVLLVALPIVLSISLGRAVLNLGGGYLFGAFAFPAALVGMLVTPLFDSRFASMLVIVSCFLFAVATDITAPYAIAGMAGGFTAIVGLSNIKERRSIIKTGIYVALTNCLMAVVLSLIINPSAPEIQAGLIAAVLNGICCYILAVSLLPVFEYLFQITTDIRLMELVASHHPLLLELQEKAPGTWQHSLNVASLAEAAAEATGTNYLLIRTGAYFHDIGKMVKPKYFTENQHTPEEKKIHSKLSPYMSTLIIRNHVKDGIELAKKHKLPKKVIDFIPQHHGNTLIKYFYVQALKKAMADGSDDIIHEDEFRYPGPKPQNAETAILMLADTVEATATAMFSGGITDEDDVRRMVRDSIRDKFEDGQFDECPMTFRDLHEIQEAFVRNLVNRFHQRVKYPTAPKVTAAPATVAPVPVSTLPQENIPAALPPQASSGEASRPEREK